MKAVTPATTEDTAGAAVEFNGVTKDFAVGLRGLRLRAVDHLSLTIAPGQIFGLLGPNGSGKSTAIKALLGLLTLDAGECRIFGVSSAHPSARQKVGYLPEAPEYPRHLSGRELVRYYGRLCGLRPPDLERRIQNVVTQVGLAAAIDRRIGTYSKGMLQRVGLAQALVHDPSILILDEPTAGVDPAGALAMGDLLRQLKAQGKTVLTTSHLLGQVEDICDRVAILDRGRVVLEGSMADLVRTKTPRAMSLDDFSPEEMDGLHAWLRARGRALEIADQPRARLDRVFLDHVAAAGRSETPR